MCRFGLPNLPAPLKKENGSSQKVLLIEGDLKLRSNSERAIPTADMQPNQVVIPLLVTDQQDGVLLPWGLRQVMTGSEESEGPGLHQETTFHCSQTSPSLLGPDQVGV